MSRNLLLATTFIVAAAFVARADPAADVQAAAKKLGENSYSWKSTVEGGFGAGATEGKTSKEGVTYLTTTMQDNTIEAVIKGDKGDKAAIKMEGGWKSIAEVTEGDQQGPGRFLARMVQGFQAPAARAEQLAGKTKDLAKSDDAFAGTLSEEAAKSVMLFGRRAAGGDGPTVNNASGSVKFWVKDGQLAKMQYNVKGSITFNGQDRDIDRTTTIEIKDVGSTKVEVPAEAKAKLEK